jgi:uncharacterized membrane protein
MNGPLYMDAVITPHRSLSRRGFIVLISVLTLINVATAAVFVGLGAGPVPLFLGMDLIAVIFALAASHRAGEIRERVQVTADEVRVILETRAGVEHVWASPTAFTRVTLGGRAERDGDLRLGLSDREIAVARGLRHCERLDFARALDRAILNARAQGHAG